MVMSVRALAPENALAPIVVTPAGMVMPVSLLAPANAFCPMVVSWLPDAKATVVTALAPPNA
jgi:hypothetical protein